MLDRALNSSAARPIFITCSNRENTHPPGRADIRKRHSDIILSFTHINSRTFRRDLWTILNCVRRVKCQAWNFVAEWTVEGIQRGTFAELNIRMKIFPLFHGSYVCLWLRCRVTNNDSIPLNPRFLAFRGTVHGHGAHMARHCDVLREADTDLALSTGNPIKTERMASFTRELRASLSTHGRAPRLNSLAL